MSESHRRKNDFLPALNKVPTTRYAFDENKPVRNNLLQTMPLIHEKRSRIDDHKLGSLKLSLERCSPENLHDILIDYVNECKTIEDIEYAIDKHRTIEPFIERVKNRKMNQLINSKRSYIKNKASDDEIKIESASSSPKGGRKSRKTRKYRKLSRRQTSSNFRK